LRVAVKPEDISDKPCSHCGGKLEFRHTIGNRRAGAPIHFFQCEDCGHVYTIKSADLALSP